MGVQCVNIESPCWIPKTHIVNQVHFNPKKGKLVLLIEKTKF